MNRVDRPIDSAFDQNEVSYRSIAPLSTYGFFAGERVALDILIVVCRLLAVLPGIALTLTLYLFAVNVPYREDWNLIPKVSQIVENNWEPFSEAVSSDTLGGLFLAVVSRFDVTAGIYFGIILQLFIFIGLCTVLEITLRVWHKNLIAPLTIIIGLLLFSPIYYELWLYGFATFQRALDGLIVVTVIWALARRTSVRLGLITCLVAIAGVVGTVASALSLWTAVTITLLLPDLRRSTTRKRHLVLWVSLAAMLAAGYLVLGLTSDFFVPGPFRAVSVFLGYVAWPVTGTAIVWVNGFVVIASIVVLAVVVRGLYQYESAVEAAIPWLALTLYGLFIAVAAATRPAADGTVSFAEWNTSFFWIGLAVIAALFIRYHGVPILSAGLARSVAAFAAIACIALGGWIYSLGYSHLEEHRKERSGRLLTLYEYDNVPYEVFAYAYSDASRAYEYLPLLADKNLGPYASSGSLPEFPSVPGPGKSWGYLDLVRCDLVFGWAWNEEYPDARVDVQIFDGEVLLATRPAEWFRSDLLKDGVGTGRYGFYLVNPPLPADEQPHNIRARIAGASDDLDGSPKELMCETTRADIDR